MKQVNIPDDLYEAIEKKLDEYGFKTVDEYVTFVLKEVINTDEKGSEDTDVFSEEEEEIIKKRLRDLGYLD
ncbi:CopG family transcriptional regulator [Thermotoga sp. KOL6]|uniref:CopG family transcriptional regulator n=1 Tax=Thermotoga sp. KOL6 TaxID=126741 RepID=UPI000C75C012|nr:CopG family transcriptional regulator [Thermotoga sp. KOL6]PLV59326.1 CopG family transcriptional regulator [Thermotoga sp. KOL6]